MAGTGDLDGRHRLSHPTNFWSKFHVVPSGRARPEKIPPGYSATQLNTARPDQKESQWCVIQKLKTKTYEKLEFVMISE